MPRGVYDRSRIKSSTATAKSEPGGSRIFWNAEELKAIGKKWIEIHLADPMGNINDQAEKAQRVLPGERQRTIPGLKSSKALVEAITVLWLEHFESLAKPQDAPQPIIEVQTLTVEIPRKLTTQEMLAEMDEPTLEALLSAKRIEREHRHLEAMQGIAIAAGVKIGQPVKPFVPKFEVFESAGPKIPRIAIVGIAADQQDELSRQIQAADLACNLTFPDHKDRMTVNRCDYAVICRNGKVTSAESDRAIHDLGRNRVALLDGHEIKDIVQKVRDFKTRQ